MEKCPHFRLSIYRLQWDLKMSPNRALAVILTVSLVVAGEDIAQLIVLPGLTARVDQRLILVAPPTGRE